MQVNIQQTFFKANEIIKSSIVETMISRNAVTILLTILIILSLGSIVFGGPLLYAACVAACAGAPPCILACAPLMFHPSP